MIFVLNTMDTFSQNKGARTFIKKKLSSLLRLFFAPRIAQHSLFIMSMRAIRHILRVASVCVLG